MPQKNLMKLMVECPDTYREVLLSDPQIELYKLVKSMQPVNADSIAGVLQISKQNASTRLHQLHLKKYLARINNGSKSGGREYEYLAVEL